MPKTWSNREIEHIDLRSRKKDGMPPVGWCILGVGLAALGVYTYLAINICMHPIQNPVDESAPISQTH